MKYTLLHFNVIATVCKQFYNKLLQILQKIADEAGFDKPVAELSDEVIIYHLKMHGTDKLEPIPGIKKDYEEDFKTALLKARGIIK